MYRSVIRVSFQRELCLNNNSRINKTQMCGMPQLHPKWNRRWMDIRILELCLQLEVGHGVLLLNEDPLLINNNRLSKYNLNLRWGNPPSNLLAKEQLPVLRRKSHKIRTGNMRSHGWLVSRTTNKVTTRKTHTYIVSIQMEPVQISNLFKCSRETSLIEIHKSISLILRNLRMQKRHFRRQYSYLCTCLIISRESGDRGRECCCLDHQGQVKLCWRRL